MPDGLRPTKAPVIFAPEFDDDCQAMLNLKAADVDQRVSSYVLLSGSVQVHPAYFWQSRISQDLLDRAIARLMALGHVTVLMGDSENFSDYMTARRSKLQSDGVGRYSFELYSYDQYGSDLDDKARVLDRLVRDRNPYVSESWSRDRKFRLIVSAALPDALEDFRGSPSYGSFRSRLPDTLRHLQEDGLVTVESLQRTMFGGLQIEARDKRWMRRWILARYWEANVDASVSIPAAREILDRSAIQATSSALFWLSFRHLFGQRASAAFRLSQVGGAARVAGLASDDRWVQFMRLWWVASAETCSEASIALNAAERQIHSRVRSRVDALRSSLFRRMRLSLFLSAATHLATTLLSGVSQSGLWIPGFLIGGFNVLPAFIDYRQTTREVESESFSQAKSAVSQWAQK